MYMSYVGNFEVFVSMHEYENKTICMSCNMVKTLI